MNTDRQIFTSPATNWNEALPIGNGRMGAMVYGGIYTDILQLNNDSIWYGSKRDRINPSALENLPVIRRAIDEGRIADAEDLCALALSGMPDTMSHYEPLANLYILFDIDPSLKITGYSRDLEFCDAVAHTSFTAGEVTYKREVFADCPDQVIAYKVTSDKKGSVSLRTSLARGNITWDLRCFREQIYRNPGYNSRVGECVNKGDDMTLLTGDVGIAFACCIKVIQKGGLLRSVGNTLVVENADEVLILIASDTSFYDSGYKENVTRIISAAASEEYEYLKIRHTKDFRSLYDRVKLELPDDQEDVVRLFNFGRYLMISGSREGSQPLNLQGIWNKDFDPMWGSKYTININTQMNYWPAEICNLSECHMPLFDLIERMRPNGKDAARRMYGCDGFMAHHNTDLFGDCAPQDTCLSSTYWVMGAAWLCLHIWEHYRYTGDIAFLKEHFETMTEAAVFLLDLTHDGEMPVYPSISPENEYLTSDGSAHTLCKGAKMDDQIMYELYKSCLDAAEVLCIVNGITDRIRKAITRLEPVKIGSDGRIMEWREEYTECDMGHRHISHLFALCPGHMITADDKTLCDAARKTLSVRLGSGGGHTGWSRAWIINMYAALGDGDKALKHIDLLRDKSLLPNMFDDHPPFQIDGNFGVTSGIARMLLQQDKDGNPVLLPALPKAWHTGSISGLKTFGGKTVDIMWRDGRITGSKVTSVT